MRKSKQSLELKQTTLALENHGKIAIEDNEL